MRGSCVARPARCKYAEEAVRPGRCLAPGVAPFGCHILPHADTRTTTPSPIPPDPLHSLGFPSRIVAPNRPGPVLFASQGGVPGKIDQLPFDGIVGIWAPKIKFWDPLNFTGALSAEQLAKKRKAELKNG